MQAKKRYILVFLSCAFLAYCYFGGYRLKNALNRRRGSLSSSVEDDTETLDRLPSYISNAGTADYLQSIGPETAEIVAKSRTVADNFDAPNEQLYVNGIVSALQSSVIRSCRMETCFNFSKCYNEFLVYVYPPEPLNSLGAAPPISPNYQKIVTAIQESRYYTPNPERACLFVLGIDTLDRDSLSEDYVRNVPSRLARLTNWNNGRNHVIFNLYSGTWPDYIEHSLGFDTGEAILAKASMSVQQTRPGFDISIPLFHKQFPLRAGSTGLASSMHFPSNKKYLLAFKGKSLTDNSIVTVNGIVSALQSSVIRSCRMETCFNFSKCYNEFLVYVYPPEPLNSLGAAPPISPNYQKIVTAIQESRYYTPNPERACLFVLGIDTLDRDSLSEDYVRNVPSRLARLTNWNNGRNHVIFNLYSGTWPDYIEHSLGFDTGEAILAKASMSVQQTRPGFDISIPLFHKQFPLRAGSTGLASSMHFPSNKKYLLAFKGKRYVHGIGSETRNSLFHLHNGRDIILVTTCRHGKSWRELQDARCDEDNREYDRYDYETLLLNSTFCLVPRGRRLGSFRFLEAIQAGCIPVLLSNDWVLPFESKIDWKQAAVWADERLLLQVPEVVRSITEERIFSLRQQTQVLWERYFGSIEKVVFTTFELFKIIGKRVFPFLWNRVKFIAMLKLAAFIYKKYFRNLCGRHADSAYRLNLALQVKIIRERLPDYPERNSIVWNTAPGALLTLPTFGDSSRFMPFLLDDMNLRPRDNYTAVIYVQIGAPLGPNNALYKLVKTITKSQFVDRIIVLWAADRPIPSKKRWPSTYHIPFHVISLGSSYQTKSAVAAAAIGDAIKVGKDGALNGRSASQHDNIKNNNNNNVNNAHNAPDGILPNDKDAESIDERPSISERFYPFDEIQTDAVLSLDEDAILNTDELDFAYTVWRDFPDRIVGYPARAHFWDDSKNAWGYTSKWTNYYSIVLTGAAFYHRYYNYLYTNWLSLLLLKTVQQSSNCEDILMNFLVSHVTRKAPIKVTQRKGYKDRETGRSPWNDPDHFIQRQSCLNTFAAVFGYMPLVRSNMRLDPILYRDPVSNLRKKYRQIELVGS